MKGEPGGEVPESEDPVGVQRPALVRDCQLHAGEESPSAKDLVLGDVPDLAGGGDGDHSSPELLVHVLENPEGVRAGGWTLQSKEIIVLVHDEVGQGVAGSQRAPSTEVLVSPFDPVGLIADSRLESLQLPHLREGQRDLRQSVGFGLDDVLIRSGEELFPHLHLHLDSDRFHEGVRLFGTVDSGDLGALERGHYRDSHDRSVLGDHGILLSGSFDRHAVIAGPERVAEQEVEPTAVVGCSVPDDGSKGELEGREILDVGETHGGLLLRPAIVIAEARSWVVAAEHPSKRTLAEIGNGPSFLVLLYSERVDHVNRLSEHLASALRVKRNRSRSRAEFVELGEILHESCGILRVLPDVGGRFVRRGEVMRLDSVILVHRAGWRGTMDESPRHIDSDVGGE